MIEQYFYRNYFFIAGKIDCANGLDERYCYELERNECNPTSEYRCSNGQCIDKVFYRDFYPDCMDESDELKFEFAMCMNEMYYQNCEDYPCVRLFFSCGDGYCYNGPSIKHDHSCKSQRDRLYFEQMPSSTLILFSHISLIYNNTKPEFICFNETLCPYLSNHDKMTMKLPSNNLTCRAFNTFTNQTYSSFESVVKDVKRFVRSCSLLPQDDQNNKCSLFQCDDGSKCLSYHRVLDGHDDCTNGEDEHQNNTCSFNHLYRFKCDNGTRCISQLLLYDRIVSKPDRNDLSQRNSIKSNFIFRHIVSTKMMNISDTFIYSLMNIRMTVVLIYNKKLVSI